MAIREQREILNRLWSQSIEVMLVQVTLSRLLTAGVM
jgi:hypothetical protein